MKYVHFFFKFFLTTSILFGAAMALKFDFLRSMIAGIWFGLGCGLPVSILAAKKDYLSTKDLPSEASELKQYREFYGDGEPKEIFNCLIESVNNVKILKKIKICRETFHIKAYTKFSRDCLGEIICINIIYRDGVSTISLSSKPRLITTSLDNGKNYRNIVLLEKEIRKHVRLSTHH